MKMKIEWIDHGRGPQCAPDPKFPSGKDMDLAGDAPNCMTLLPYPAKGCGLYIVECETCGLRIGITTAGRPDDPRSVKIACRFLRHHTIESSDVAALLLAGDADGAQAVAFLESAIAAEPGEFAQIRLRWVKQLLIRSRPPPTCSMTAGGS